MKCLFWNVGNNKINSIIEELVINEDCQLFSLAEYDDNPMELLKELGKKGYDFYHVPQIGCKRIEIFTTCKPGRIEHLSDTSHYTIKRIPHNDLGYINFVFVHFPSKLHSNDFDHQEESRLLKIEIEKVETEIDSEQTVVIGDFNMNPFEVGMIAANALHSFPTKFEATKRSRTINGRKYKMFYNPMWSLMGDAKTPLGTYHYSSSHHISFYWNMFDQVIVRPSLCDHINPNEIKIITNVGEIELLKNDKPSKSISDHLPLLFKLG